MDWELRSRAITIVLFAIVTCLGMGFSIYILFNAHSVYTDLLAVAFLVLSAVAGFFNIFTSYSYYRSYLYDDYLKQIEKGLRPLVSLPTVAIAMPVYNEDTKDVKSNMLRLMQMNYPKDKLHYYILDDSTEQEKINDLKNFSKKNKIVYIQRDNRKGFKAGALNNLLKHSKEEFLAIFDYDEYLKNPNFLRETLPFFQDEKIAYVQTEKKFSKGNFFSDTVDIFDGFFFKFIQPSRALNNTAIFAGSCGLIRTSHLRKIGGFPEFVTEDTFFSFESDVNGFKSLYLPKIYALGKPIESFSELAKQQWRYNYGDTQFLQYFLNRLTGKSKKKTHSTLSSIDYFTHGFGLNYISGVLILFTILSVLIVFSQISQLTNITFAQFLSGQAPIIGFETLGIAAFALSVLTPIIITKMYFKSASKGAMMLVLNFALAFIRTKAAIMAIFNFKKRPSWDIDRFASSPKRIFSALRNSFIETAFSIALFVLGATALFINNIYGGVWLIWYGAFYISTIVMFYIYN